MLSKANKDTIIKVINNKVHFINEGITFCVSNDIQYFIKFIGFDPNGCKFTDAALKKIHRYDNQIKSN